MMQTRTGTRPTKASPRCHFPARLPVDVYEAGKEEAEARGISMNKLLCEIMRDALLGRGSDKETMTASA